ncbi:hypothetical protein CAEBREN_04697 [Caenorhabditis brenneri]|uniref:Uncharacterized protein n=1 Tax=Caenorhabditis brenneri TaxID=135651 RepID=G0NLS5_CAEBE|nr:hypothetical protein CAEBREN_04697 [Caenorhabditis brenneri]
MSEKYSDDSFFFANYGCCIPTESYAWILVALFITSIVVLLFCMLATATIRWMYKRRMRKRLHDLKRKFLMDQLKAQEFEAKLNFMAQKNKSTKNEDFSREGGEKEKFTIFVDPAQHQAQQMNSAKNKKKNSNMQKVAPVGGAGNNNGQQPIYDRDETPIAQSTLASKSNTNAKPKAENHWLHIPKNQKSKPIPDYTPTSPTPSTQPSPMAPVAPIAPMIPHPPPPPPPTATRPPSYQAPPSAKYPPGLPLQQPIPAGSYFEVPRPKKSPPKKKSPEFEFSTSPIIPLDPNDVSPEKKDPLAPPTTTGTATIPPTPSGFTTTPSSDLTSTPATSTPTTSTPATTTPSGSTSSPGTTSGVTTSNPSTSPSKTNGVTPPKKPSKMSLDDVKQNLQYGMDDIVSPLGPPENKGSDRKEVRKEGAGGRGEWKYYSINGENKTPRTTTSSSVTKSSTSHRRGSGFWIYDSTGSNRFESASSGTTGSRKTTNSTVSSSILKTDSSQYRTASIEQFPHGAFTFQ